MRKFNATVFALAGLTLLLALPRPALAVFHFAHISEIMASYDGDDTVQFVEIEMKFGSQNLIANSVMAVFGADGTYLTDMIVFPSDVANSGAGVTYIVGTASFQTVSGLTLDFIAAKADLPNAGGMVCFGGGGGATPQNPPNWSRTNLDSYVDCLAYGSYSGPTKLLSGDPTPLLPVGHSLERVAETDDNATDFDCADPATPTNNAGTSASLPATVIQCPEPSLAFAQMTALGSLIWLARRRTDEKTPTEN
jgi:hypothetical protein